MNRLGDNLALLQRCHDGEKYLFAVRCAEVALAGHEFAMAHNPAISSPTDFRPLVDLLWRKETAMDEEWLPALEELMNTDSALANAHFSVYFADLAIRCLNTQEDMNLTLIENFFFTFLDLFKGIAWQSHNLAFDIQSEEEFLRSPTMDVELHEQHSLLNLLMSNAYDVDAIKRHAYSYGEAIFHKVDPNLGSP